MSGGNHSPSLEDLLPHLYTDQDPLYRDTSAFSTIPAPGHHQQQGHYGEGQSHSDGRNRRHKGLQEGGEAGSRFGAKSVSERHLKERVLWISMLNATSSSKDPKVWMPVLLSEEFRPRLYSEEGLDVLFTCGGEGGNDYSEYEKENMKKRVWMSFNVVEDPRAAKQITDQYSESALSVKTRQGIADLKRKLGEIVPQYDDFVRIRNKTNPFECVGKSIFVNRSAVKLANLDAVLKYRISQAHRDVGKHKKLHFVDLCGGPGGFSEYLLWRTKNNCKGWAITKKVDPEEEEEEEGRRGLSRGNYGADFDVARFNAGANPQMLTVDYGMDGSGDVTRVENIKGWLEMLDGKRKGEEEQGEKEAQVDGADLVVADGAINTVGREEYQERLNSRVLLAQVILGLGLLNTKGTFICKVFDNYTEFNIGIMYILFHLFNRVSVMKPVSSRPASSERFIIAQELLLSSGGSNGYAHGYSSDGQTTMNTTKAVIDHLLGVLDALNTMCDGRNNAEEEQKEKLLFGDPFSVIEVVSFDLIQRDEDFLTYMRAMSERLGKKQQESLLAIINQGKNEEEDYSDQDREAKRVKEMCKKEWHLP
eukprot:Nk52_evm39s967 gene=Nk52_evmTU39s967